MKLRKAVNILFKNTNKDIMTRVNKNLSTIIKYYSNEHAVKNYAEKGIRSDGGEDSTKNANSEETTPITGNNKKNKDDGPPDFSSALKRMKTVSEKKSVKS